MDALAKLPTAQFIPEFWFPSMEPSSSSFSALAVGGSARGVSTSSGPVGRGTQNEKVHVGSVLVGASALLQISVHISQGPALHQGRP